MKQVRRFVYWLGFRPRFGSIFYSPSLHATIDFWGKPKRWWQ